MSSSPDAATLRAQARTRLDPTVFAFLDGSAGDGSAATANLAAFRRRSLVPRVLRPVSDVDPATRLLNTTVAAPIGVAPLPRLSRVSRQGELDLALAAAATGTLYCAPTNASRSLEELSLDGAPRWFQLYVHADDTITADLVARAAAAGYQAIVITVDRPVPAAGRPHPPDDPDDRAIDAYPNLARYGGDEVLRHRHAPDFDLATLRALCAASRLPVVVKGVLHPADARQAVDAGCRGIWVSNHGGRLLHRAAAPLDVLAGIVEEVGHDAEVHVDGGVRSASDVAIALALGASCVHVGRPLAFALGVDGREGAERLLATMIAELTTVMASLGVRRVHELDPTYVRPTPRS